MLGGGSQRRGFGNFCQLTCCVRLNKEHNFCLTIDDLRSEKDAIVAESVNKESQTWRKPQFEELQEQLVLLDVQRILAKYGLLGSCTTYP